MCPLLDCVSDEDKAPVAHAGGDQIIVLPAPLVTVNGTGSTDDHKIVSYQWTRDRTSPAAGVSCSLATIVNSYLIHFQARCKGR